MSRNSSDDTDPQEEEGPDQQEGSDSSDGEGLSFEKWNRWCTEANPLDSYLKKKREEEEEE